MKSRRSNRGSKKRAAHRVDRQALLLQSAFAIVLVAIVASGLTLVTSAQDMRELYRMMGEVQRERDGLAAEYSRLLLERSALSSMQSIEEAAENELDMAFPEGVGEVLE